MTFTKALSLVLVVAFVLLVVAPARAEAMEPTTILLIAGAAVVLIVLVAYVIIANVREHQRGTAAAERSEPIEPAAMPAQVALAQGA